MSERSTRRNICFDVPSSEHNGTNIPLMDRKLATHIRVVLCVGMLPGPYADMHTRVMAGLQPISDWILSKYGFVNSDTKYQWQ